MSETISSEELQVTAFDIILHSGNARTLIHEGFKDMRQEKFEEADEQLTKANEEILQAHKAQTNLLKEYASGDHHGSCTRPLDDNDDLTGSGN